MAKTCELCEKRIAEVFIDVTRNLKRHKISICLNCALDYKIFIPANLENNNDVIRLLDTIDQKEKERSADALKLCPACAKSLFDILNSETAGCPECYEFFEEEIKNYFKNKKIPLKFSGSLPQKIQDFKYILSSRAAMQFKMQQAVKEENYEKAAVYRDFLRTLESGNIDFIDDKEL